MFTLIFTLRKGFLPFAIISLLLSALAPKICAQAPMDPAWIDPSFELRQQQARDRMAYPEIIPHEGSPMHNHDVRIGVIGSLGINIHTAQFRLLSFDPRYTASASQSLSAFPMISNSMRNAAGGSFGINIEVPIERTFSLGLRFMSSSQNVSLSLHENSSINLALTTLGVETIGILHLENSWNIFGGISFAGISSAKYRFHPTILEVPETEMPQTEFMIVSPIVGMSYDIALSEQKQVNKGAWFLVPEISGMIGINNILQSFKADEFWRFSQLRFGLGVKYAWQ